MIKKYLNSKQLKELSNDIAQLKLYSKKVLSLEDACELYGFSKSYFYKLTSGGILEFSKPLGKKIFFDREKLDLFFLKNSSKTSEEIISEAATYVSTN